MTIQTDNLDKWEVEFTVYFNGLLKNFVKFEANDVQYKLGVYSFYRNTISVACFREEAIRGFTIKRTLREK